MREDLLERLIDVYEASEDITIEQVFSEARKKWTGFEELNKEDVVELKRQLQEHIQWKEDCLNREERSNSYLLSSEEDLSLESLPAGRFASDSESKRRRFHKKYVEAFINNISVPKSLDELYSFFMDGNDAQILIQDASGTGETNWTVPRWAKRGDIVLFMHAKTARSTLTGLRTKVRSTYSPDTQMARRFEQAIADQLTFHEKYGGKIFAVGRVNGKPEEEKKNPITHVKSKVFCDIDSLFLLDEPIDISEFNRFINISRLSAITPLYGDIYERLKEIIVHKNRTPGYFRYSFSTPFPHSQVNQNNWIQLGLEYRNAFTLEAQFRHCYVDYLLKELGDQKTIYMECSCYKGTNPATFVDNVIRFDKKLLPVEVKLNIRLESNLEGQCEQYCGLDRLVLDKHSGREAALNRVINDKVLVIDTYAVYMFSVVTKKIEFLFDLSDLKSKEDIRTLRRTVIESLQGL